LDAPGQDYDSPACQRVLPPVLQEPGFIRPKRAPALKDAGAQHEVRAMGRFATIRSILL
jgi:hypothetical protein